MEYSVKVEKPSKVLRKLIVTIAAPTVDSTFQRKYQEVGSKAKIKGFRPGKVPLPVLKKFYGPDVIRRVMSSLIDESYSKALKDENIRPVGQPTIDSTEEAKKSGNHLPQEGKEMTYVATVEILPEIPLKTYTGFSLKKDKIKVSQKDVDQLVAQIVDRHAEVVVKEDAENAKTKKGDFVDFEFKGGMVTDAGVDYQSNMSGTHLLEIGSNQFIPGFEDEMIGLKKGEEKSFKITFPKDYGEPTMAGQKAHFDIKINEIKEKKLPELTDEFAKEAGYESVKDFQEKAKESITRNQEDQATQKLRETLLKSLIDKNPFDLPQSLVQAQVQANIRDLAENWKRQGMADNMIQETIEKEMKNIEKRAENQVRVGFLLEEIAKKEKIEVKKEHLDSEMEKMAQSMNMQVAQLEEFYTKNPERKEGLVFRIKEDLTIQHILSQSKIKE